MEKELVNHPQHYGGSENPYAYLFNVLKYIVRSGKKDDNPPIQDLKKAAWYLNRRIKTLEENHD
jgi:hypothetical protein